jgi:pSer/pThr/pTyr-binding forkhead associated (FHA) protein
MELVAKLKCMNTGQSITLVNNLIIGRKTLLKSFLEDPDLSREHLQYTFKDDKHFIMDLISTNRTKINGELIEQGVEIEIFENDIIEFGNQKFTFTLSNCQPLPEN